MKKKSAQLDVHVCYSGVRFRLDVLRFLSYRQWSNVLSYYLALILLLFPTILT